MPARIAIADHVARWSSSPFGSIADAPWHVTGGAEALVRAALDGLGDDFRLADGIAVHRSARVEAGAVLKPPAIIGARCFVGAGAYLRGGVFLDEDCVVGPGSELKTSLLFQGAKLAHFNFVGDSILGANVNLEAGAVIANHRNECADPTIRIRFEDGVIETGVEKFGALVADRVRIGANAVIAPGAVLVSGTVVPRLSLVDQHPDAEDCTRS